SVVSGAADHAADTSAKSANIQGRTVLNMASAANFGQARMYRHHNPTKPAAPMVPRRTVISSMKTEAMEVQNAMRLRSGSTKGGMAMLGDIFPCRSGDRQIIGMIRRSTVFVI